MHMHPPYEQITADPRSMPKSPLLKIGEGVNDVVKAQSCGRSEQILKPCSVSPKQPVNDMCDSLANPGVQHVGALHAQQEMQQRAPVQKTTPTPTPTSASMEDFPPLPKSNARTPTKDYAEIVRTPRKPTNKNSAVGGEPWSVVSRRKTRKRNESSPRQRSSTSRAPLASLRGNKQERTVTLYVKNIACDEEEKDDEIKARLRQYVKQRKAIRLINMQIVHNRFCQDTVGCKLTVPVSSQDVLLADDFWPVEVDERVDETKTNQPK